MNKLFACLVLVLLCAPAQAQYVLEFGADWCGPCQDMKPNMKAVQSEGYDIRYVDVDTKDGDKVQKENKVTRVPTLIAFALNKEGKSVEVARCTGYASKDTIRKYCVKSGQKSKKEKEAVKAAKSKKREELAALLMQGMLANEHIDMNRTPPWEYARGAAQFADHLMAELDRSEHPQPVRAAIPPGAFYPCNGGMCIGPQR